MSDGSAVAVLTDDQRLAVRQIEAAWRALAEVRTVQDAVTVRRGADVLVQVVKSAKLGPRMQHEVGMFKVESSAKAGETLHDMPKNQGGYAAGVLDGLTPPPTLDDLGVSRFESHYWQKVAAVPAEKRRAFYRLVLANIEAAEATADERAKLGPQEVTTAGTLQYWHADVHRTSSEDEWLTPPDIIERVLEVLGAIDLDPCSNTFGDPNVPAAVRWTEADDGLGRTWRGRVYMNPPYGAAIAGWTAKIRDEHAAGHVTAAVALVPARTDTEWWGALADTAVCFVRGRLKFSGAANSAPFPSAVAYFGEDRAAFADAFAELGDIWVRLEA